MSILLFVAVLAVLIVVHELGHFLAAKMSGVRVDEFGIGFPPRAASFKPEKSETRYSLNWLPLGGFVKIFGEEVTDEAQSGADSHRSFINKPKLTQVWILAAGVIGNLIAAWIFLSIGFMIGIVAPADLYDSAYVTDVHVGVTAVLPDSPADVAGIMAGDRLRAVRREASEQLIQTADDLSIFLGESTEPVTLVYGRGGSTEEAVVTPKLGIIEEGAAIGVGIDTIGIVTLPPHLAVWEGLDATVRLTGAIAVGLTQFFSDAFTGSADLSQVTGPVGLVGLVGDAGALGFTYLLSFTALISINLALINLIPFPALDGGRILFVIIEAIKGSPINARVANTLNTIGFALLILLMIVVTYNDIVTIMSS